MTERAQRQRVAIKKVGSRGSRAEMLNNSPIVVRDPWSDAVKKPLRDTLSKHRDIRHRETNRPEGYSKTLG